MPDLRKTSIALGTTPASLPTISNPRPAAPKIDAPRAAGGLADGVTGGGFAPYTRPNGPGPVGTAAGAEAALASFESAGK